MKILIAVPTRSRIHYRTADWLQKQKSLFGRDATFCYSVFGIEATRIKLVSYFKKLNYTHLFFLDDDIEPPLDCIDNLLRHDKDIITARYLTYASGVIADVAPSEEVAKLCEVDRCGLGACLIKERVFEKLPVEEYFRMTYKNGDVVEGEDYKFCDTVKSLGFQIWKDNSVVCEHYKEVPIKYISEKLILV